MHSDPTNNCRVCGLKQPYPQYGENGKTPTYEICDCCGVEFGYEDMTPSSAEKFRNMWLQNGAKWFRATAKPNNWSIGRQLQAIPNAFQSSET